MATTTTFAKDRRSSRVFMRLRVVVAGKDHNRKRFREACETIVINAHGALLVLTHSVDDDAQLVVTNPFTQEEQECRVVYLGEDSGNGQRVGIEFLTPAPHFWGMEFSQPDWSGVSARRHDLAQN
jgi:PilZ domain-containing protein